MIRPDGTKIDTEGNIYTTYAAKGITIFDRDGKKLGEINMPGMCRNFCFGGPDLDYLYFACDTIYRLKIKAHGYDVRK